MLKLLLFFFIYDYTPIIIPTNHSQEVVQKILILVPAESIYTFPRVGSISLANSFQLSAKRVALRTFWTLIYDLWTRSRISSMLWSLDRLHSANEQKGHCSYGIQLIYFNCIDLLRIHISIYTVYCLILLLILLRWCTVTKI